MKYLVPPTAESQAAIVRLANLDSQKDAPSTSPVVLPEEECVNRFGAALFKSGSSLAKTGPAAFAEGSDGNPGVTPNKWGDAVDGNEPGEITSVPLQEDRSSDRPPVEDLPTRALPASSCPPAEPPQQITSGATVLHPSEPAADEPAKTLPVPIQGQRIAVASRSPIRMAVLSIIATVVLAGLIGTWLWSDTPTLAMRDDHKRGSAQTSLPDLPDAVTKAVQENRVSHEDAPLREETIIRDHTGSNRIVAHGAHDVPETPQRSPEEHRRSEALSDDRIKTEDTIRSGNQVMNSGNWVVGPVNKHKTRTRNQTPAELASRGDDQASQLTRAPKKSAPVNRKQRAERKSGLEPNDRTAANQRVKTLSREKNDDEPFFPFRF